MSTKPVTQRTVENRTTHFDSFITIVKEQAAATELLDGWDVLIPPSRDFGYESTPANALIFAALYVDGVHQAILLDNGRVTDWSAVVYVSPMDSDDLFVIADTFLNYLAVGCGVAPSEIDAHLRSGSPELVQLLRTSFRQEPLLDEERIATLNNVCGDQIVRKIT